MAEQPEPPVSVLILSCNGRKYLGNCLHSVLGQDFPCDDYEVVVVDNGSTDGSADYVEEHYPEVRVVRFDRNHGIDEGINRAIHHLRGRYVGYLHQDAVAHRRWLSELVEVMNSDPTIGLVESNTILPELREYAGNRQDFSVNRAYVCDLTSLGTLGFHAVAVTESSPPIPTLTAYCAGCLMNRAAFDELGYMLDPGFFAYADDLDVGLRLNASGYRVLLAPRSIVYHNRDYHYRWSWRNLRWAYLATRNGFLAFYKVSYASEFVVLFPRLILGKLLRAGEHCDSTLGRVAYAVAGTPLLLAALAAALTRFPTYRERRRLTLSRRTKPPGWLVQRLLDQEWRSDPAIWAARLAEDRALQDSQV
jgi:GT2 family glycosyltransferase